MSLKSQARSAGTQSPIWEGVGCCKVLSLEAEGPAFKTPLLRLPNISSLDPRPETWLLNGGPILFTSLWSGDRKLKMMDFHMFAERANTARMEEVGNRKANGECKNGDTEP